MRSIWIISNILTSYYSGLHVFFSGGGTGRRPFQDLAGGAVEGRRRAARRRQELQSIDQGVCIVTTRSLCRLRWSSTSASCVMMMITSTLQREGSAGGKHGGAGAGPSSSDQEGPRTPDPKTLRRLAQNREAARKSRLRKKVIIISIKKFSGQVNPQNTRRKSLARKRH